MSVKLIGLGLGLLLSATALAACKTDTAQYPGPGTSVAVAKQVCEINALAEERDAIVTSISSPEYGRETDTKDHRSTILREKLDHYSAEVEASYRFVTANCNSYNLCMAKNNYDESACVDARHAWTESHEKFNNLAIAIKELDDGYGHGHGHGHGHDGHGHHGDCRADCSVQGGVFATGCCYDGD
jgi:hypothetical protein